MDSSAIRILMISTYFQPAWSWGGPVRSMWNLARGLASQAIRVTVLTTNAEQHGIINLSRERCEEGVKIITEKVLGQGKYPMLNRFGMAPGLLKSMVQEIRKADLVHISGFWGPVPLIATWLCRTYKVYCVISPRENLQEWGMSQKRFKKIIFLNTLGWAQFRGATDFHFTTNQEKEEALSLLIKDRGFIVPNSIEFAAKGDGERFREKYQLLKDTMLFGIVGRIHKKKGFEIIIPALSQVPGNLKIKFFIIGNDENGYKNVVERMVQQYGVADRIVFTGLLKGKELQDAYAALDFLVVPSYSENFGMVVIEALGQGTPVLVSDNVALKEWILQNEVGVVLPFDIEDWTQAIREFCKNGKKSEWLPERLAMVAKDSFSIEKVAQLMIREYRRIISSSDNS